MKTCLILGITGVSQSGKDTAAVALIEQLNFVRVSFADPIRDMLYALNPVVQAHMDRGQYGSYLTNIRVKDVVDFNGWDKAKQLPEVRALLQRLGTDAGRNVLGQSIWTDTAMKKVDALLLMQNVVITDVRFDNEARVIADRDGYIVKITRPGITAINSHVSDAGIDPKLVDIEILNNWSIEKLQNNLLSLTQRLMRRNEEKLVMSLEDRVFVSTTGVKVA